RLAALSGPSGPSEGAPDAGPCADILESLRSQALREFFLLISSDWPFLVTERQATEYGAKRFREHAERFDRLMDYAERILEGGASGVGSGLFEATLEYAEKAASQPARPGPPADPGRQALGVLIQNALRDLAEIAEVDDPFPWLDFSVLSASNPRD
ncbi:MAG: DUF1957 domain-containing protein, partial [Bacillota bacterium]